MASIKSFETFVSETVNVNLKKVEETVVVESTINEEGEADLNAKVEDKVIPVSEMLEKCYEAMLSEAKMYQEDAHDDHTIETYMIENASLVAGLSSSCLTQMKEDMETEAYEACLNRMSEAYSKKMNEVKEMKHAVDTDDVD
jgi:hypothetical protein